MATLTSSKLHVELVGCFRVWSATPGTKCNSMQLHLFNSLIWLTCEWEIRIQTLSAVVWIQSNLTSLHASNADSYNGLLPILPTALKGSPQRSQPGDSEWKGYCMWPYMSSWGGPPAICTQKWYKAWWINLEEEFRVLYSVCSVVSERTIFSKGLGRSRTVLATRCQSHAVGYKEPPYNLQTPSPKQMNHSWRWGCCVPNTRKPFRGPLYKLDLVLELQCQVFI